ncbi:MAG: hypothetical protein IIA70_00825 [Proteobacteria bacterium]|nr:hypothetical protein [Pseudomonadota bacterium]
MAKISIKAALLGAAILSGVAWAEPVLAQQDDVLGKARAAEGQKHWSAAEEFYRQVLEQDPTQGSLWERLSDIIAQQGRPLEAAEALAMAADLDPGNADLQARTANAFAAANEPERALAFMNQALAIESDNSFFLSSKAATETWLGRYAEAEADLLRAFDEGLEVTEENLVRLGSLQQWQDKLDASLETLLKVTQLNPENIEYMVMLARLYSWRGAYTRSIETIEEYLARGGSPLTHAQEKAVVLAWADQPDASLAVSDPQLALHPDDVPLLIGQAIATSRARDYETSFSLLDRLEQLTGPSDEIIEIRRILTAPVRSNLDVRFRASGDRDNIDIYGGQVVATLAIKPGLYFRIGGEGYHMTAPAFSGLDRIDNVGSIVKKGAWAELEIPFSQDVRAIIRGGGASTSFGADIFTYDVKIRARTNDNTFITVGANRDLFMASPRSLSLGITNAEYFVQVDHTPNLDWFAQGRLAYFDLNDGNRNIKGDFTIIRNVRRRADYNINIGLNATIFGYSMDLPNGYYDPSIYQRYLVPVYFYFKFSDDDGLNITIAPGMQKDNTMQSFQFAGAASAELTIGLYRDWMFKAFVEGFIGGGSALAGQTDYWIVAGGARLVRRF